MGRQANPTGLCVKCTRPIPVFIRVDGNRRYHRNRKYCFECSPFKTYKGRAFEGEHQREAPLRTCRKCGGEFSRGDFSTNSKQRGYKNSYCKTCAAETLRNSRQRFKDECIAYKGGMCVGCGYSRCRDALEFHHLGDKEFQLSRYSKCILDETVRAELDKCELRCSNCHREAHALPGSFRVSGVIEDHAQSQILSHDHPH